MPQFDGGVCSFLGTIDSTFDVESTLIMLEDKEHEKRLLAKRAEIAARFADANLSKGKSASNAPAKPAEEFGPVSDEEKREGSAKTKARAQQRKKAKAKAKHGTSEPEVGVEASESTEKSAEAKEVFEDWAEGTTEPEAGIEASESAVKSAGARKTFDARAKEALDQNQYPGVVFLRGKIVAVGVDKDDCHVRLERFTKAELGASVNVKDVLVREGLPGDAVAMIYTHNEVGDTESSTDHDRTPAPASAKPSANSPQPGSKKRRPNENYAEWISRILPDGEQPGWPGVLFDRSKGRLGAYGPNLGRKTLAEFLAHIETLE